MVFTGSSGYGLGLLGFKEVSYPSASVASERVQLVAKYLFGKYLDPEA